MARIGELTSEGRLLTINGGSLRRAASVRYRQVALTAAIAVSGHVAALTWASNSAAPAGGRSSATATLQARLIETERAAPGGDIGFAAKSSAVPSPPTFSAPARTHRTARQPDPDRSISQQAPARASTALPVDSDGLLLDYLPRGMLTRAPAPQSSIEIPFPADVEDEVHLTAALSLFIDERGAVQRVRIDSDVLPLPMEEAARAAFLRARFSPGEIEGRPVRSLVRIEVTFDSDVTHAGSSPAP